MKLQPAALLLAICVLAAISVAAVLLLVDQRRSNTEILAALDAVKQSLDVEVNRSQQLESTMAALSERVVSLELEISELRRRARSAPRPSATVSPLPQPLEAIPTAFVAASPSAFADVPNTVETVIETVPISWAADWSRYQPAGILAQPPPAALQRKLTDPAFMRKLYWTYVGLQAADIASTTAAIRSGKGREGNPLLGDVAHSPARLIGVKAATTVATIYTVEKLREKHPVAASVTLIAINATLAAVTINNVSVAHSNRVKR
jgi:hypothetical protein